MQILQQEIEEMSIKRERELVGKQQEDLIRTLILHAHPPETLNPDNLEAAAEALLLKRKRAIQKVGLPALRKLSVTEFKKVFEEFALEHPGVHPKGPQEDARQMAAYLKRQQLSRYRLTALKAFFCH